jgi:hypothetical protein
MAAAWAVAMADHVVLAEHPLDGDRVGRELGHQSGQTGLDLRQALLDRRLGVGAQHADVHRGQGRAGVPSTTATPPQPGSMPGRTAHLQS